MSIETHHTSITIRAGCGCELLGFAIDYDEATIRTRVAGCPGHVSAPVNVQYRVMAGLLLIASIQWPEVLTDDVLQFRRIAPCSV